ncbi:MAG: KH domain-containing protein [Thermoplasmata archaeon]
MSRLIHLRIPKDRIGALIGKEGATKKLIEESTGVKLLIDSVEGDVEIDHSDAKDPAMAIVVESIVKAIGRGFSPENAMELVEEDTVLEIIDIRDYVGRKPNHIARVKSRVIGSKGKTRRIIEELTGTHISVFGNTVSIIGGTVQVSVAGKALDMLMSGSEHSAVYHFLEHNRDIIRAVQMGFD